MNDLKKQARTQAKILRDGLDLPNAAQQLAAFAAQLLPLCPPQAAIAGYMPFGSEMDILPLLEQLRRLGQMVALPVILAPATPLEFRLWDDNTVFVPGPWGIRQPAPGTPVVRPGLVLAPLLAFDAQGWRLGYGGGYYDRTLAALDNPVSVGVAFAAQQVEHVPHDHHDQPLDFMLTEQGLVRL